MGRRHLIVAASGSEHNHSHDFPGKPFWLHGSEEDLSLDQKPFETQFYVERLHLESFRQFRSLDQSWGRINVLVGANGSGKSSLLDALTSGLQALVSRLYDRFLAIPVLDPGRNLALGAQHGGVSVTMRALGNLYQSRLGIFLSGQPAHYPAPEGRQAADLVELISDRLSNNTMALLPVLALYSSHRNAQPYDLVPTQVSIRIEELFGQSFDGDKEFEGFQRWFRSLEDLENQIRINDGQHRDPRLVAVRSAFESLLPRFANLRIERTINRMVVDKMGATFDLGRLSDGERNLIALVGDIARRLAVACPTGNPLHGFGVVLIDEIEQHLHPGWQRMIVPRLAEIFPNLQFFITTHSPLVASSAPPHSLYLVHDGTVSRREAYGQDVALVLDEVFETGPRNEEIQVQLDQLFEAITLEEKEASMDRLNDLERILGTSDPMLVRARTRMRGLGLL